jgi:hypothetical protein
VLSAAKQNQKQEATMKTYYTVALSVLAGIGIGAVESKDFTRKPSRPST